MGGTNQATAPPPPAGSNVSGQTVRFHENAGKAHFHNDSTRVKCVMPYDDFRDAYTNWRDAWGRLALGSGDLVLMGTDGHGGHAQVTFSSYTHMSKPFISKFTCRIFAT